MLSDLWFCCLPPFGFSSLSPSFSLSYLLICPWQLTDLRVSGLTQTVSSTSSQETRIGKVPMASVAVSLGNISTKAFMHTHKRNLLIVLSSVHICFKWQLQWSISLWCSPSLMVVSYSTPFPPFVKWFVHFPLEVQNYFGASPPPPLDNFWPPECSLSPSHKCSHCSHETVVYSHTLVHFFVCSFFQGTVEGKCSALYVRMKALSPPMK